MASYYDSLSILKTSHDANEIALLGQRFDEHHMTFFPDTNVVFNDLNCEEREPEPAMSEDNALELIKNWPALGGSQYSFQGHMLSFFLYGTEDYRFDAIALSVPSRPYAMQSEFKRAFRALVTTIHTTFKAIRTVIDYELLSPDSFWKEELARVRNNVLKGTYEVDLR